MLSFQLYKGLSLLFSSNFKMYILKKVKKGTTKRNIYKINALLYHLTITQNLYLNKHTQKQVKL